MSVRKIFIFSLPRSGSSLLQRLLAGHPEIETVPEPWLLLPLFYLFRDKGIYADFDYSVYREAVRGLIDRLPDKESDYFNAVEKLLDSLYEKLAGDAEYFLDKTPRYHVIAAEIMAAFPESKFIFLFRNPLAILASVISTWKWAHIFRFDLYAGLDALCDAFANSQAEIAAVHYETLVQKPEKTLNEICHYLGIPARSDLIEALSEKPIPAGELGHPVPLRGEREGYDRAISMDSVKRWVDVLRSNPIRWLQAKRYLDWIGEDRLDLMGYQIHDLEKLLRHVPMSTQLMGQDLMGAGRSIISMLFETPMLRDKIKKWPDYHSMYAHR
jgi:hypothetical protein